MKKMLNKITTVFFYIYATYTFVVMPLWFMAFLIEDVVKKDYPSFIPLAFFGWVGLGCLFLFISKLEEEVK